MKKTTIYHIVCALLLLGSCKAPATNDKTLVVQSCLNKVATISGLEYLSKSKLILVDDSLSGTITALHLASNTVVKQKVAPAAMKVYYPGIKGVNTNVRHLVIKSLFVKQAEAAVDIELPNINMLLIFNLKKVDGSWRVVYYNARQW